MSSCLAQESELRYEPLEVLQYVRGFSRLSPQLPAGIYCGILDTSGDVRQIGGNKATKPGGGVLERWPAQIRLQNMDSPPKEMTILTDWNTEVSRGNRPWGVVLAVERVRNPNRPHSMVHASRGRWAETSREAGRTDTQAQDQTLCVLYFLRGRDEELRPRDGGPTASYQTDSRESSVHALLWGSAPHTHPFFSQDACSMIL